MGDKYFSTMPCLFPRVQRALHLVATATGLEVLGVDHRNLRCAFKTLKSVWHGERTMVACQGSCDIARSEVCRTTVCELGGGYSW